MNFNLILKKLNLEGLQISLIFFLFLIPIPFKPYYDLLGYFLFAIVTVFLVYPLILSIIVTKVKKNITKKFNLIYNETSIQKKIQIFSLIIIISIHFIKEYFYLGIKTINLYVLIILGIFLVINVILNILNFNNNFELKLYKIILIEFFKYFLYLIIIVGLILLNTLIFSFSLLFLAVK